MVLVLIAIGVVLRLLIAELAKPATGTLKTVVKTSSGAYVPTGYTAGAVVPAGAALPAGLVVSPGGAVAAPKGHVRMRDIVDAKAGVGTSSGRKVRSGFFLTTLVLLLGASAAALVGLVALLIGLAVQHAVK